MTLILAALTDEYIALASDRRMTVSKGKKIIRQEDTDTKTFNLCGHFLMGFTGLARIDGHRMEHWVAEVLSGVNAADYFKVLTDEITEAFRRSGHTGRIAHAFLAVGFARDRQTEDLRPLSIVISNSLDPEGNFSVRSLGDEFRLSAELLGNRRQLIRSVGWPVPDDTASTLDYRIRVAARGEPLNPALTVAPLVLAIRDTARTSDDNVGESVLFSSLPKKAVPAPRVALGQVNMQDEPSALFLPQNVRHPRKADVYGPALICPDQPIITGVAISTEGPIGPAEGY
jgi:hypothetical protein